MASFIATRVKRKYRLSIEDAQELYRKFFVNTTIYKRWQDEVNEILVKDGFGQAIVNE